MSVLQSLLEGLGALGPGGSLAPLAIIIVAALPVGEVRFSVPLALFVYDMGWGAAVVWSLIGNFGIVPVLFWALPWGERLVRLVPAGDRLMDWLFARTRRKHTARVEKYEEVGLMLLVAIPIPGTGAWMGALVAYLFGLSWRKSWRHMYAGVTIACFLVLVICLTAEGFAKKWLL